ncbi:MAG TPA: hypothetical protein VHU61_03410 [Solirubrobacteraceae bacterium]|nr:hypothetical protein [Solirubrobacteraceae bacterium]
MLGIPHELATGLARCTIALALVGCVVILAACGSSTGPRAQSANGHTLGVKFSTCMRGHGVSNFPDPQTAAGPQIPIALTKNPSPAFTAAMDACKHFFTAADPHPPAASASQKAAAVKLAQCMREHGVPNYPDPTYKDGQLLPPSIADPAINPASPAFSDASKKCQSS